jgi:ribonuclease HII
MYEYERPYWEMNEQVIGVDEAGRGPMAGPCVVCGVVLPIDYHHPLINDSKKLTKKQRQQCFVDILKDATTIVIEIVTPETIDALNIYRATQEAMENIVLQVNMVALVDAMPIQSTTKTYSIIKGDQKSISIAAASIVAKVIRDAIMVQLDLKYPQYGFKKHKGYPTQQHKEAILLYGRSATHRKSFMFKSES